MSPFIIVPLQRNWVMWGILLSTCPSVRPWTESCPLCISTNTSRIRFIFTHLINPLIELQSVCRELIFSKIQKCIFWPNYFTSWLSTWCSGLSWQWRHNGPDGVSNHQPHDCSLNHLFRRKWKKKSKLPVTGLCAGNSPVTSEFPTQKVSNAMTSSSSGCQDTYQGWMVSFTYGTKGIWIDTICDPPYEFDLCPHPWPWPRIFKIKFCISRVSVIGLIHLNSLICKLWTAMWEWIYIYIYMYIFH